MTDPNASPYEGKFNKLGSGSEVDRYESHFGLDAAKVKAATTDFLHRKGSGAEQEVHGRSFGLGQDGLDRAKTLASVKGEGAEQDRYGAHFSMPSDAGEKVGRKLSEGMKQNQGAETMS